MLIEVGIAEVYSDLPRGDWMVLLLDRIVMDDVIELLEASYMTVFAGLSKRIRVCLGER